MILDARPDLTDTPLHERWTDVFRIDPLVHVGVMGSIIAGTFQAYLKDRFLGPIPYVLADAFFFVAFVAWLGAIAVRRDPIRGPGAMPFLLTAIIFIPLLYLLHPGTPLLIALAGLRTWSMFPIATLIGLAVIRHPAQVRAYVGLILGLCVVTAAYGIYQYTLGPESVAAIGDLAIQRHGSSIVFTLDAQSEVGFRAFSTFTFPAPFASMMVFGILLAVGIVTASSRPRALRLGAALLIPLFFMGMAVSGTRAALINLFVGLLVLAWYRRLTLGQVALIPVVLVAFYLGTLVTAGQILRRYGSLVANEGLLWSYVGNPIRTAVTTLASDPIGLGLGRTGIGVPFPISSRQPAGYFVFTDGDIGRAAVELGVVGVVLLLAVVFGLIRYTPWAARTLLHTDAEDIGLGVATLLAASAVSMLIGSPVSSVPHGIIWWFFLGAMLKLAILRDHETPSPPPRLTVLP